jgi:hypothetical protein
MARRLRVAESPRGVGRLDSVPRLRLELAHGLVFQTVNFRAMRARRFHAGRDRQADGRGRTRKVSAIHGLEWVVMRYLCRMAVKLTATEGIEIATKAAQITVSRSCMVTTFPPTFNAGPPLGLVKLHSGTAPGSLRPG